MRRRTTSAIVGKWRITAMELWDKDYLDMVEPAYIQFRRDGLGEFKFGCVVGGLDCTLYADATEFTWVRLGRLRLRGPRGAQFEFTLAAIAQNARPPPIAPTPCVA